MSGDKPTSNSLFTNLSADENASETTEVESLCLNCGKNGMTKILLTKIPFYKEIILTSFECLHCGENNNQTQFGGKFQDQGLKVKLNVETEKDLNRQVVVSDYATISIPQLELEIPPISRNGEVTNIEGILNRIAKNLESDQPKRRELEPSSADKIDQFLKKLEDCKDLTTPFSFVLQDPSGNSFIENPFTPYKDKAMEMIHYKPTKEENALLGIVDDDDDEEEEEVTKELTDENLTEEVMMFRSNCFSCNAPCETNMKVTSIFRNLRAALDTYEEIPHFKEVVIMATVCSVCGHRSNEVKAGSGIEPKGVSIELRITDPLDMTRDILKSETCSVSIPELDFEMGAGTLGGRFTTLEGLFQNIKDQLKEDNPLIIGDSAEESISQRMAVFINKLDEIISCKKKVHVVFDDPSGNSYVQNLYAPDEDPEMKIVKYERNFEQNEELGLNDMKTENY